MSEEPSVVEEHTTMNEEEVDETEADANENGADGVDDAHNCEAEDCEAGPASASPSGTTAATTTTTPARKKKTSTAKKKTDSNDKGTTSSLDGKRRPKKALKIKTDTVGSSGGSENGDTAAAEYSSSPSNSLVIKKRVTVAKEETSGGNTTPRGAAGGRGEKKKKKSTAAGADGEAARMKRKSTKKKDSDGKNEPEQDQFLVNLTGTTVGDKYELGKRLGKGGQAIVYLGITKDTNKKVAVKQIPLDEKMKRDMIKDLYTEIDFMKKLNHKNIVHYVDHIETDNNLFLIIEFVDKGSLGDMLRSTGTFPENLVSYFIRQALEGLAYLHNEHRTVHRDIKADNLLMMEDGTLKLADFGVATVMQPINEKTIADPDVVGTPYWMAPEIIQLARITGAADVWSIGATVIELLTGAPPYMDLRPMQALFKIVDDELPPIPSGLSEECHDFLLKCFHRNSKTRLSATALLEHPFITKYQDEKTLAAAKEIKTAANANEIRRIFCEAAGIPLSSLRTFNNAPVSSQDGRPFNTPPQSDTVSSTGTPPVTTTTSAKSIDEEVEASAETKQQQQQQQQESSAVEATAVPQPQPQPQQQQQEEKQQTEQQAAPSPAPAVAVVEEPSQPAATSPAANTSTSTCTTTSIASEAACPTLPSTATSTATELSHLSSSPTASGTPPSPASSGGEGKKKKSLFAKLFGGFASKKEKSPTNASSSSSSSSTTPKNARKFSNH